MPRTTCVVPLCSNAGDHIIPKDEKRRNAWIHAIRRGETRFSKWTPSSQYSYVCRAHFTEHDYISTTSRETVTLQRVLKKTAVPSKFSWTPQTPESVVSRNERFIKRFKRDVSYSDSDCIDDDETNDTEHADRSILEIGANETLEIEIESEVILETCDTDSTPQFISAETQTPKHAMFSIENFRNDNEGIHFYTGLENIDKFHFVLNTLGPAAYCLNYLKFNVSTISIPDQFFLVLVKLRRHSTNFELSRMFGVSESTVFNIYYTWICFMYRQWKEVNIWPSQDLVRYFSPSGFKMQFPSTRVIVDGTECPIKKPNNPKSQQATFSTYKNRNTMKVLVGASPGGLVSYVSESYAGSTSDRQIVERSALVNMCDPTDSVMADKGFNVQDLFATNNITLNIPTFFRKRNRMSGNLVMRDRKIASKRVHIERVIGLAKTYKVLVEPMTATETNLSTEITFVCFMLCNFRNCIVPKNA